MSKLLKIRDQDSSHIPPYKRSIGGQTTLRGSQKYKKQKYSSQGITPYTWMVLSLMLVFIAYWLLPWDTISTFVKSIKEFSQDPYETDPVLYHSFSVTTPVFSETPSASEDQNAILLFKVKSGDSLRSILENHGIPPEDSNAAQEALVSFKQERKIKNIIKAGDFLEGRFDTDAKLKAIKITLSGDEYLEIARTDGTGFAASVTSIEKALKERIVIGTIQSSFAAAARKAGLGYDMVDDLVDIFSDRISFHRDFRKGDRFSLIFHEHEKVDGSGSTSGPILAAALEVRGNHYTAIRYVGADGKPRYFNEDGKLIGNTFLRYPLKFSRISSHFSDGRLHPVLKVKRPHNGVDFAAPTGTPVRTVGDGVVTFAGRKGGHGIMIEIKHSDRYKTGYSHLSAISPGIVRGKKVTQGTVIGKVGMTGLATGPHLHFSLYDYGKYVDPLKAKLPKAEELRPDIKISPSYLARARYTLEHYQTIADTKILQP
jgi:murein DD-endopeptidase MepM/ murein hydrolase activator NlpD